MALLARGRAGLQAAARDVAEVGGEPLALPVDVADPASVDGAVDHIEAELGPLEIWVNNAMTSVFAPLWEIDPQEFRRVTEVTYLGCVYGTMAALRLMRSRDSGVIVQVGSALAYRGIPLQSAYCGAKHAIEGFTESLRCELLHEGSRVQLTMVQLPALNTPQFSWVLSRLDRHPRPVAPIYQPELAARAVVHAAGCHRREWWVGGSTVATILANTVARGLLDRYLARTGFESQQSEASSGPCRPANLWHAADETSDAGSHGVFDHQARPSSLQWPLNRWRRVLTPALAAAGAGFGAWRTRRR